MSNKNHRDENLIQIEGDNLSDPIGGNKRKQVKETGHSNFPIHRKC